MLESLIGWSVGLMCIYLFYQFRTLFLLMLLVIDGFFGNFNKYHCFAIFASVILQMFGIYNFVFIKICLAIYSFISNFSYISKKYTSGKKCINAILKLADLTNMKTDEMYMIEKINSMSTSVENFANDVNDNYMLIKHKVLDNVNYAINTEIFTDAIYTIKIIDTGINTIVNFGCTNLLLIGEFIYWIPLFRTYIDKANGYATACNNLYLQYEGDNVFDSPNLATDVGASHLNMDIDIDKLGDLAGLMTDFLASIENINDAPKVNNFLELDNNFLTSIEHLNNTPKINNILELDDNFTKLDDDYLIDDEINEIINKGGKVNDKNFENAKNNIEIITSSMCDNSKIVLKRKNS